MSARTRSGAGGSVREKRFFRRSFSRPARRDPEPRHSPEKRRVLYGKFNVVGSQLPQPRLCPLPGALGPGNIYLFRKLGGLEEEGDFVVDHLTEATAHGDMSRSLSRHEPHLPGDEERKEGDVAGKDAELPQGARGLHHIYLLLHHHAVRSDNLEEELLHLLSPHHLLGLLDRFFDLTGLLLLMFVFFPRGSLPPRISQGIYIIIGVLIFCVLMIILLSRKSFVDHLSERFTNLEKSFLSKFAKRIIEIQENLTRIGSPLTIIFFVIISFFTWLSMSAALYFVVLTLGISLPSVWIIPFVCALLNIGITVPSSPGYVGVYQFLLVYLLSIFGVPKHEGFTISILYHASWYIPYTISGFLFLLREHLRIRDIQKLEEKEEATA